MLTSNTGGGSRSTCTSCSEGRRAGDPRGDTASDEPCEGANPAPLPFLPRFFLPVASTASSFPTPVENASSRAAAAAVLTSRPELPVRADDPAAVESESSLALEVDAIALEVTAVSLLSPLTMAADVAATDALNARARLLDLLRAGLALPLLRSAATSALVVACLAMIFWMTVARFLPERGAIRYL